GVNGANGGLLERFQSVFEALALARICGRRARFVEFLAKADFQLARRFVSEGDRHNPVDRGQAAAQDLHDARHQLGGLSGSGRRLDDEALAERFANGPPCFGVADGRPKWSHGMFLKSTNASNWSPFFRLIRSSSWGPQTQR